MKLKNIFKRPDGRLMIRKMIKGKRYTIYTRDQETAKKIRTKLKNNILPKEKTKEKTVKEWMLEWREKFKKPFVAKNTFRTILTVTNSISKKYKSKNLSELTAESIQNYLNGIKKSKTKDNLVLYFNAALKKAIQLEYITKNPMNAVERERKTKYKQEAFGYGEQVKILKALEQSNIKEEIICYLMTGARPSELPKWEDFDLKNNFVFIRGTKTEQSKKRIVEISETYAKHLRALNFYQFKKRTKIHAEFKKICVSEGIKGINLYKLRHTFASNHFILGTPAKQVSEWLGHTNIAMTLNTYTSLDRTATREKIIALYKGYYYLTPNLTPNQR